MRRRLRGGPEANPSAANPHSPIRLAVDCAIIQCIWKTVLACWPVPLPTLRRLLNFVLISPSHRFMSLRFKELRLFAIALSGAWLCLVLGCSQHDPITSYKVRKPELVDPMLVSLATPPPAAATDQQTLGLIVPVGDTSWFFKLTGEARTVQAQEAVFDAFLQSIKFSQPPDTKPSWTLPEGWQQLPGSQFRYATIRLPEKDSGGKPLEISVSTAGGDVVANINRWRGQLNLKPIAADELARTTQTLKIDGHEATLVSLVGKGSGQMSGAPFAGGGGALPADHPPTSPSATSSGKSGGAGDLRYTVPSEWSPGKPNAISLAAFKVADGNKQAEITVSTAGGELLANVNRWRGQLGLSPIDSAELAKSVKKIETLGSTGDYVEIIGPESAAKHETILGVQTEAGGRTWFVKLRGDSDVAEQEKPRFEAFVKSLKLP